MKRIVKWFLLVLGIAIAGLALVAALAMKRVYYGTQVYETVPPALPATLVTPAILVFSKTNGFRHQEAIPAANAAIGEIAKARGWSIFVTENGAAFRPDYLRRFQATVWNNTSGDVLSQDQKDAFRSYVENGGGFVGIHCAGGDPHYEWRWYVETLLGAQFKGHPLNPQFQQATVRMENLQDPVVQGMNREWVRTDEWYSFKTSPRAGPVTVLATLDERTYRPKILWMDISMGGDHPVIWKHCVGKGRAFYSALGHSATSYDEPEYRKVLEGAIYWAAGFTGEGCPQ
jgi:type 1 glutamine amidotransferase